MEELRSKLNELIDLKAPGISGSRILAIRQLAVSAGANAKNIGQIMVDFNKSCPVTHKLGVLYVYDAVARALQEKKDVDPNCNAGYESMSDSLSQFMEDLKARNQTPDSFDKMSKVLQIWQKAETFPESILTDFKNTYFHTPYTRSPPGSPGPNYFWGGLDEELKPKSPVAAAGAAHAPVNAASVLATLANLAKASSPSPAAATISQPTETKPSLLDQLMAKTASPQTAVPQPRGRSGAQAPLRARSRSRSPDTHRVRESTRHEAREIKNPAPKYLETDPTLIPTNSIKVLSRTLFVGNIPSYMDEKAVRQAIVDVCPVQSLVYNKEKRHAFIKVYTRNDAVNVRESWEQKGRTQGFELRARWGVGYGPRDCFDYSKGVSIIAIDRLTDADIRWALTAENGGTGNVPLAGGQVMEEPDIEVGAGLSSRVVNKKPVQQMPMMPMMPMMQGGADGQPQFPMMFPGMMPMPGMPGMPGMPAGMPAMPMPGMPFPFMPGQDMSKLMNQDKSKEDV